jgi:hypothetical protein
VPDRARAADSKSFIAKKSGQAMFLQEQRGLKALKERVFGCWDLEISTESQTRSPARS